MGEAGTGTAEKWWKTLWSQMVKQEGSSPCLCDQHPRTPENLSLGGHVGFDSLPDQLVSKSVTQGFSFNILCVGEHSPLRTDVG
uniref:Uncharacterized protein n=1 Tax=Buteo japonicus TaxID=224669 RepID=A0A8C0BEW6_9AVES